MPEKYQLPLKIVCILLGMMVAIQLSRAIAQKNPLNQFTIPATAALLATPVEPTAAVKKDTTNAPAAVAVRNDASNMPPVAVSGRSGRSGINPSSKAQAALPPATQARVDKIVQSEILAPIQRPLPMALMGIAGSDVFLRAPNGQTGLLRIGEELGGVKLLKIGTNRVIVEQDQQQKELTIFPGLGGQSLLSNEKEKSQ